MKNWKIFVPMIMFGVLLALPWVHRALFENLLFAIPDIDRVSAHWWVAGISIISMWIGCMIVGLGG